MIVTVLFKRWQFWLTIVISIIVILGITRVIAGAAGFALAFPNALVAWGTLILGIATFMLVITSREQENQRRTDELDRENRCRKESWLNEVIDWAVKIANVAFTGTGEVKYVPFEEGSKLARQFHALGNKVFKYQSIDALSPHTEKISENIGVELHTAVLAVISCRKSIAPFIEKIYDSPNLSEVTEEYKKLSDAEHNLRDKAIEVIRVATNIKTSLITCL